jgi:cytochrome b pre-mRNA-processing protein 3
MCSISFERFCEENVMLFDWLENRARRRKAAEGLYQAALTQSRDPAFYARLEVADTLDGRFDLLCLHISLILNRLNGDAARSAHKLAQSLFDAMFRRMELDLREMGIGDLAVPRHMKKMMKAFNGRLHAYAAALNADEKDALTHAVMKNLYRSADAPTDHAAATAQYMRDARAILAAMNLTDIEQGRVAFPPVPVTTPNPLQNPVQTPGQRAA